VQLRQWQRRTLAETGLAVDCAADDYGADMPAETAAEVAMQPAWGSSLLLPLLGCAVLPWGALQGQGPRPQETMLQLFPQQQQWAALGQTPARLQVNAVLLQHQLQQHVVTARQVLWPARSTAVVAVTREGLCQQFLGCHLLKPLTSDAAASPACRDQKVCQQVG
jgi:hypothetical protein